MTQHSVQQREEVRVEDSANFQQRRRVVRDMNDARRVAVAKLTQFIWLVFGVLEALTLFRVFLKLIAANPDNPLARFIYRLTDLFLWPFHGLTPTPSVEGSVIEIPSLIAVVVFAFLAWAIVRLVWVIFYRPDRRVVSTVEEERAYRD